MSEQTNCARCSAECMPWKIESDIFIYCSAWCEGNHLKEMDDSAALQVCSACGNKRFCFDLASSLSEDQVERFRGHPLLKRRYCSLICSKRDGSAFGLRGKGV